MAELHKKILQDLLQVKNVDCGLRGGEMLLDQFPMITLNNGVTVCNFSSNHSYKFDTGETLPACLKVTADRHKLSIIETKIPRWKGHDASDSNKYEKWEFEHHNLNENSFENCLFIFINPLCILLLIAHSLSCNRKSGIAT